MKKLFLLCVLTISLVSCQFTETMVLNEDGSGRMSLSMDLGEMMAFGGEMSQDSTAVKQDTIISFKDIFREKQDSISQLPVDEQKRLKAMEGYNIHLVADPEINVMVIEIFTDFKNISEANDLMKGFEQSGNLMPDGVSGNKDTGEPELLGVTYSFNNGVFIRDAYIKDVERHKAQIDSMKQAESFMGSMRYKLKYTFPRRIKNSSVKDATFSLDGKTIEIERSFLDYFKNPDVLDLEVELEDQ